MTRTTPTNDAATRRRGDAEYLRTRLRRTRLRRMRLRGLLRLPRPYRARCRREPAEVELLRKGKVPMVDEQIGELTAEAVASGRLQMADDAVHAGTHRPEVEPDGATSITRAWREPGKLRRRSNEGTAPQYSAWSSRDPARPLSTGSVDTGSAAAERPRAAVGAAGSKYHEAWRRRPGPPRTAREVHSGCGWIAEPVRHHTSSISSSTSRTALGAGTTGRERAELRL